MKNAPKKAAKKVVKKVAPKVVTPKADVEMRVVHLPIDLKKAFQARRENEDTSNEELVSVICSKHLPALVAELLSSGVRHSTGLKPARWPFRKEVLDSLREASHTTGVPASHLLVACLRRALPEGAKRKAKS